MPDRVTSPTADFPHRRAPAKNWAALWALSLAGTLLVLGSAEAFWRSRGHRPSVVDGPEVWAYHRSRVDAGGRRSVVVLGWSRILLGFSTDTFRARFPNYKVTQLALAGHAPIAALRDLANDDTFEGVVICDITAEGLGRETWNEQQRFVDYYREQYQDWHAWHVAPRVFLQDRLVVANPRVQVIRVLRDALTKRTFPTPLYAITRADRSMLADYSLTDWDERRLKALQQNVKGKEESTLDFEEWSADVSEVQRFVARIQARGGQVVFVRMPVAGEMRIREELAYPRGRFWDSMADSTTAETLHYMDVPAMQRLQMPDHSHLDFRDGPAFTNALLDELVRRGVLKETAGNGA